MSPCGRCCHVFLLPQLLPAARCELGMCTPLLLLGQLLLAVGPPADLLCAPTSAPAGSLVLLHLHLGSGAADTVPEEDVLSSAP